MTPAQCRAARGLLDWDPCRLAATAEIDISIVTEFEREVPVSKTAVRQMQRTLEQAGVEFTNDGAPGVRRRPPPRVLGIDELNASNDE